MKTEIARRSLNNTLSRNLEFVWYRSLAEIRADISRSFLGLMWWVVEPLIYMGIFYLVFGFVFNQRGEGYISFLLCGLVIWKWFDSTVRSSSMSVVQNMAIIYQVYLPKIVFPAVAALITAARFFLVFVLLITFLLIDGAYFSSAWITDLPILIVIQIVLMFGFSLIFAAIIPLVPDVKFLLDNGMSLLFFVSGIFFRIDSVPQSVRYFFDLNPIAILIQNYRLVLLDGRNIDWGDLLPVIVVSVALLLLGVVLIRYFDRSYAKRAYL